MSEGFRGLRLYNTLTRTKEDFVPIDPSNVRMYVCGPTVYDYAHIGNARPAIVFDVLFRLLQHLYGPDHVSYVRNITDVDDKINARALRDYGAEIVAGRLSLNEAIRRVTEPTYKQYQKDVTALGCLPPTFQPRATEFVLPRPDGKADMVTLIQSLIDRGHAYVANGEVLFDVASMADYGQLSKRPLDEQQAGARIAVDAHKKNPADFVLWKESSTDEPGWEASFRISDDSRRALGLPSNTVSIRGRPGWHIECSAMSAAYFGEVFDIHGGGLDLIFPHHENEIAQSRCAHGTEVMANYWLHNGFLQVEGKKMSKSEGNFVTIHELLETDKFGGRTWPGEVLRLAMLMTHYREPIDFSVRRLFHAESVLRKLKSFADQRVNRTLDSDVWEQFNAQLESDLNIPMAITVLEQACDGFSPRNQYTVFKALSLLGFKTGRTKIGKVADSIRIAIRSMKTLSRNEMAEIFSSVRRASHFPSGQMKPETEILDFISEIAALHDEFSTDFQSWEQAAGRLRNRQFEFSESAEERAVRDLVNRRLAFIGSKNWAEADRIRDELLAQGIQLKDGKDPATGERITTWEVKR